MSTRPQRSKPPPGFFWQGLLIVLPLAVMAVVAAREIVNDRAAAEREMRDRAEGLLARINSSFLDKFNEHLFNYQLVASDPIFRFHRDLYPRGDPHRGRGPLPSGGMFADRAVEVFQAFTPGDFVLTPIFYPDGVLSWTGLTIDQPHPLDTRPPSPAPWRLQLTRVQEAAWDELARAAATSNNLEAVRTAVQRFEATQPGHDATDNASFVLDRTALEANPTQRATEKMLMGPDTVSDAGIVLRSLRLAEAIKFAGQLTNKLALWDRLVLQAETSPDFLTPALIQNIEPVVQNDPELLPCLKTLKEFWAALEQSHGLGEAIQGSGIDFSKNTNLWVDYGGSRWFCALKTGDGRQNPAYNVYTRSSVFPRSAVVWMFQRAFADTGISVPPYFELTAQLGTREPMVISPSPEPARSPSRNAIAEIGGQIPNLAGAPYLLRIHVADERAMMAAYHQRVSVIKGLLLVSAISAFVGFFAARRAFYRQLRLNEMKSDFVSSVSHELRAPIASVRLMAEGLERGKIAEPVKQQEYFKFIVQECRRLSSLIENVLDFSRIEQGRKQYELESTDLAALTQQTVKVMETYAAERGVGISLRVTGEPVPVNLDGKAMQQALVNLIDNAIKHSPKGAEVTVGLEFTLQRVPVGVQPSGCPQSKAQPHSHGPDQVKLWVEDHGEGITASEHEKIFERFYRVGSELRRETQGVGIGLSIVKHIVEAHNGRVTVRSAPGQGSRFTIELPAGNGTQLPNS